MSPKGAKGTPKVNPKSTNIPPKITTLKKVEKGGVRALSFDPFLTHFWSKNTSKNQCEKRCQKKLKKTLKVCKKQGATPSPEMYFLTGFLQRRFLQNSVFTREKQCFLKIQSFECAHSFGIYPSKK